MHDDDDFFQFLIMIYWQNDRDKSTIAYLLLLRQIKDINNFKHNLYKYNGESLILKEPLTHCDNDSAFIEFELERFQIRLTE